MKHHQRSCVPWHQRTCVPWHQRSCVPYHTSQGRLLRGRHQDSGNQHRLSTARPPSQMTDGTPGQMCHASVLLLWLSGTTPSPNGARKGVATTRRGPKLRPWNTEGRLCLFGFMECALPLMAWQGRAVQCMRALTVVGRRLCLWDGERRPGSGGLQRAARNDARRTPRRRRKEVVLKSPEGARGQA